MDVQLLSQCIKYAHSANQHRQFATAVRWCNQALHLVPELPEAWFNLGIAYGGLGKKEEALRALERARIGAISTADAQNSIGLQLIELGAYAQAEQCLNRAIELAPNFSYAHSNLGKLREKQGLMSKAESSFRTAIQAQPSLAPAYSNLAGILNAQYRHEEADEACRKAIELDPNLPEAWNNRGNALKELKRIDEALASYDQAIAIQPDFADAYLNSSLAHLLMSDFKQGWERYEWRWRHPENEKIRHADVPLWLGDDTLSGKTILLWSEQGLGDTLQFCRYAHRVAELGATVVLEVPQPLVSLLNNLPGVSQVIAQGRPLPRIDFQCPLLSLPLAFKTTLADIVGQPYLPAPMQKPWVENLALTNQPKIGVVWSGSTGNKNDSKRSISLPLFSTCMPRGIDVICLQKDIRDADRSALSQYPAIRIVSDYLKDFTDTAALINTLNLVITVDTSVAHLAGALGKEVWILLPYIPDWRWLLDRDDSPWYNSATLFRQPALGDWESVLHQVRNRLPAA